jgi:hypothetical protein
MCPRSKYARELQSVDDKRGSLSWLSGFRPESGRSSEIRPEPGQPTADSRQPQRRLVPLQWLSTTTISASQVRSLPPPIRSPVPTAPIRSPVPTGVHGRRARWGTASTCSGHHDGVHRVTPRSASSRRQPQPRAVVEFAEPTVRLSRRGHLQVDRAETLGAVAPPLPRHASRNVEHGGCRSG